MKINFGKITNPSLIEDIKAGRATAFEFEDNLYEFQLIFEEDQIVIADAIGRYVPMSIEDLLQLKQAISSVSTPLAIIKEASYQLDSLLSDVTIAVPA